MGTSTYPPTTRLSTIGIITCRLSMHANSQDPSPPSPTDNEISPPCVSSCPSSKDSPPSHTKPFTRVRAPEGYVEEGRGKSTSADLASQYRHVGLPVREHNATQTQTHTINTLTRAQSEPRGESCPPPDRGRNRRESSARGDTHAEATSKDAASECHAADTPRGGAVHYNEADGALELHRGWWLRDSAPAEGGKPWHLLRQRDAICDSRGGSSLPRSWARKDIRWRHGKRRMGSSQGVHILVCA